MNSDTGEQGAQRLALGKLREWFFPEEDVPRSDEELLGMYLVSVSRNTNLLLDVGPDKHGLIPEKYLGALRRLRANLDRPGAT